MNSLIVSFSEKEKSLICKKHYKKSIFRKTQISLIVAGILVFPSFAIATPITTTITGSSPAPINVPLVHKGDLINIEALLSTTDLNENGEGEPLIVLSSSGGANINISAYEQPQAKSFTATQDGETLSAYIVGYDGDESATISVDVNQKPRFTQQQKDAMAKASASLNTDAAGLSTLAAACLAIPDPSVTKICAFGAGVSAGAVWALSAKLNELALDPIDMNYTVIAVPITPSLSLFAAQTGVTQAEADTLNALLQNEEQAIGLASAIMVSINRANGAIAANSTSWETKQLQAASQYALQLSALLASQPTLRTSAVQALQSAGFPVLQITANDVYNFEWKVYSSGLPADLILNLTKLGIDSNTIDRIRRLAYVQDINAVAGSFSAILGGTGVNTALTSASLSLADFAIANGVPLVPGQEAHGEGFVTESSGSKLTFEFEAQLHENNPLTLEGEFGLVDHATGFAILHAKFGRTVLIGTTVVIDGTYTDNVGSSGTFRIIATDNRKLGKGLDTFSISLSSGFKAGGVLGGGQIKVKTKTDNQD